MVPVMKSHNQKSFKYRSGLATHAPTISHEDEKTALILFIAGGFTVWFLF